MSDTVMEPGRKRDAKAELKAAKAYAKAQRPWYKKKRWLLALGILAIVAISIATSGGNSASNPSGAAAQPAAETGGAQVAKSDGTSGGVGQKLTNAGTTYEVTKVLTTKAIGDPQITGARADGKFVVVSLSLTNNKDETKTFMSGSAHVLTADGDKYEPSDKTVLAFGDDSLLMKDIQPDLTAKGKLAFDLPPSKVAGSKLVIEDLFGDGQVTVDLGL